MLVKLVCSLITGSNAMFIFRCLCEAQKIYEKLNKNEQNLKN